MTADRPKPLRRAFDDWRRYHQKHAKARIAYLKAARENALSEATVIPLIAIQDKLDMLEARIRSEVQHYGWQQKVRVINNVVFDHINVHPASEIDPDNQIFPLGPRVISAGVSMSGRAPKEST
jgi:hypothetical protein